ncbi:MAG: hypothetical protein HYW23_03385 [Candidatus Aenigmarchaeota archaeon]|nr:hypothetical protein [Candidatus Aenigmarchaeota archaeon]
MEFEAIAVLGLGKEHSKWQGAVVGYINQFEHKSRISEAKLCGNHFYNVRDVKSVKSQPMDCLMCKFLNEESSEFKAIDDSYIFNVETASGLATEDVILDSATILEEKVKEFDRALKKLK